MESTPIESFAIEGARAALSYLGIELPLSQQWRRLDAESDGACARHGRIATNIGSAGLVVWYSLSGSNETWREGRCDLRLTSNPGTEHQFFVKQTENGVVAVPMSTSRRTQLMARAVYKMLEGLGGNADAVKRRLIQLGCNPDATGVRELVDDMFGSYIVLELVDERWRMASTNGSNVLLANKPRLPDAIAELMSATA